MNEPDDYQQQINSSLLEKQLDLLQSNDLSFRLMSRFQESLVERMTVFFQEDKAKDMGSRPPLYPTQREEFRPVEVTQKNQEMPQLSWKDKGRSG